MTMRSCYVGIDVGGTGIKTLIVDDSLRRLAFSKVSTAPAYKAVRGVRNITGPQRTFDADKLWALAKESLKNALGALDLSVYEPRSIAVSSVGCTVIFLDRHNKQIDVLGDDGELGEELSRYRSRFDDAGYFLKTGYPLESGLAAMHMSACLSRGSFEPPAEVLSTDDWIVKCLSGVRTRNKSTAFSSGCWDQEEGGWLGAFVERTSLSRKVLGSPIESGQPVGPVRAELKSELGLRNLPMVATGGHDYECAAFAFRPFLKNSIINITGTVDLMAYFDNSLEDRMQGLRRMRDAHVVPGEWSHMIETFGAIQTEWLKNLTSPGVPWETLFDEMERTLPCENGELFIPKIYGATFPSADKSGRGAYLGLSGRTGRPDLLKATIEGMNYQGRMMKDRLIGSRDIKGALLLGGSSKDMACAQLKADMLKMRLTIPEETEGSALGAAGLGAIGSGSMSFDEFCEKTSKMKVVEVLPDKGRAAYFTDFYHEVWLPAEKACGEINMEANKVIRKHYGGFGNETH